MSLQSCVFIVKEESEPSSDFLDAVTKKYPTAASVVLETPELMKCLPGTGMVIDKFNPKDCKELLGEDNNIKKNKIFWCCSSDSPLNEKDIQPFTILKSKENGVEMVAYVEGDFASYSQSESSLSNEYYAVQKYLIPKIQLLCGEHDDDFNKVIEALGSTDNKKEFEAEFFGGQRGVLVLMAKGLTETFEHKNELKYNQDWGWSSDHCGLVKAEEKKSRFSKSPATQPVEAEAPKSDVVWVRPGPTVNGNVLVKAWYYEVTGAPKGSEIPPSTLEILGFKQQIPIPKARYEEIRTRIKTIVVCNPPESRDRTKSEATPDTKPRGTDTSSKHIPASTGASAVPVPVLSEASKSKTADFYTKPGHMGKTLLDNASKEILSPDTIKSVFEKHKSWYDQLSDKVRIDVDWSLTQPYEAFDELSKVDPTSLAVFCYDKCCRLFLANARIKELEAKVKPEVKEGVRATQMQAPPEAKKSRFGYAKAS